MAILRRTAAGFAALVVAVALCNVGTASARPSPSPSWTIESGTSKAGKVLVGNCVGTSNKPTALSYPPSLEWSAKQVCTGNYDLQKVCVTLQELDYYSHWYDRTTQSCSRETVAATQYWGQSATCVAAGGHGTFRTHGRGYAWPDGVLHTGDSYSGAATLC